MTDHELKELAKLRQILAERVPGFWDDLISEPGVTENIESQQDSQ